MKTLKQRIAKNKIKMVLQHADSNPNMADNKNMNHYRVKLTMSGRQMSLYFSQGYGITHDPDVESVINAICLDASSIENTRSFEDWANDFGYDTDSRKAEKTYKACEREAGKFKVFLGNDTLYNDFLFNTESL